MARNSVDTFLEVNGKQISVINSYSPSKNLQQFKRLNDIGAVVTGSGKDCTLYCKKLSLRYRHPDLETDIQKESTIVLSSNQSCPVNTTEKLSNDKRYLFESLSVKIYDDNDSTILLETTFTPELFEEYRQEQRLLFGFDSFPTMFIELLERCGGKGDLDYSDPERSPSSSPTAGFSHTKAKLPSMYPNENEYLNKSPHVKKRNKRVSISDPICSSISKNNNNNDVDLIALLVCSCSKLNNSSDSRWMNAKETSLLSKDVVSLRSDQAFQKLRRRPISEAIFCLIETNFFKEIVHLSINLKQADEASLRKHLLTRIIHHKDYARCLEMEYKKLLENRKLLVEGYLNLKANYGRLETHINTLKETYDEKYEGKLAEISSTSQVRIAELQNAIREQESLFATQTGQLRGEIEAKVKTTQILQAELTEVKKINNELKEKIVSLNNRIEEQQKESDALKSEEYDKKALSHHIENNQKQTEQLYMQIKNLEESLAELTSQKKSLETIVEGSKARENELREMLKISAKEILRGNEMIERLQNALLKTRERLKDYKTQVSNKLETISLDTEQQCVLQSKITELEAENIVVKASRDNLLREKTLLEQKVTRYEELIIHHEERIRELDEQLNNHIIDSVVNPAGTTNLLRLTPTNLPSLPPLSSASFLYNNKLSFNESLSPFNDSPGLLTPAFRFDLSSSPNSKGIAVSSFTNADTVSGTIYSAYNDISESKINSMCIGAQEAPKRTLLEQSVDSKFVSTTNNGDFGYQATHVAKTDALNNGSETSQSYEQIETLTTINKQTDSLQLDLSFGYKPKNLESEKLTKQNEQSTVDSTLSVEYSIGDQAMCPLSSSTIESLEAPHFGTGDEN